MKQTSRREAIVAAACAAGIVYCVAVAALCSYHGAKKTAEFFKKRPVFCLMALAPVFLVFCAILFSIFVPLLGCKSPTREEFVNELGNRILLAVERRRGGVRIYLRGPTSDQTSDITEMEARRMSAALNRLL
jgi:hypothetical protein